VPPRLGLGWCHPIIGSIFEAPFERETAAPLKYCGGNEQSEHANPESDRSLGADQLQYGVIEHELEEGEGLYGVIEVEEPVVERRW
jgi:hypothetical protein